MKKEGTRVSISIRQMLLELRYQHMNKLSKYERGLVRSLLSGTDGLGIDPSDRLIGDYLTDKQIDCVKRLYENC